MKDQCQSSIERYRTSSFHPLPLLFPLGACGRSASVSGIPRGWLSRGCSCTNYASAAPIRESTMMYVDSLSSLHSQSAGISGKNQISGSRLASWQRWSMKSTRNPGLLLLAPLPCMHARPLLDELSSSSYSFAHRISIDSCMTNPGSCGLDVHHPLIYLLIGPSPPTPDAALLSTPIRSLQRHSPSSLARTSIHSSFVITVRFPLYRSAPRLEMETSYKDP